jgi:hypothetical protein
MAGRGPFMASIARDMAMAASFYRSIDGQTRKGLIILFIIYFIKFFHIYFIYSLTFGGIPAYEVSKMPDAFPSRE